MAKSHAWQGHRERINRISWSPTGRFLASASQDHTSCIWQLGDTKPTKTLRLRGNSVYSVAWYPSEQEDLVALATSHSGIVLWKPSLDTREHLSAHEGNVYSVAWSPGGQYLCSGGLDNRVLVWSQDSSTSMWIKDIDLFGHTSQVNEIVWSPDSQLIASASDDDTISIWSIRNRRQLTRLDARSDGVTALSWSPLGNLLVSGASNGALRIWDPHTGVQSRVLERHEGVVTDVAFSPDGLLLASKSLDDTVILWDTQTWALVEQVDEAASGAWFAGLDFHPTESMLATLNDKGRSVQLWNVLRERIGGRATIEESVSYTSAKVVLLGESGVGKTALSLALSGQEFAETVSTHGRSVVPLNDPTPKPDSSEEVREIFLWDLAGQDEYRLTHHLYLGQVALALLVFDAAGQSDPRDSITYWSTALARHRSNTSSTPTLVGSKLLVAARSDLGALAVGKEELESLLCDFSIHSFHLISAKRGYGVDDLKKAVHGLIDWSRLVTTTSTRELIGIKRYVANQRQKCELVSLDELFDGFSRMPATRSQSSAASRSRFLTCIKLLEAQGLVRRLSFGNRVLLRPELLDGYVSSIVRTATYGHSGAGCVEEHMVLSGGDKLVAPEISTSLDEFEERLLLISAVEELLSHEVAFRERGFLVFPALFQQGSARNEEVGERRVSIEFSGAIANIYSALVVRLGHSGLFKRDRLWNSAASFLHASGQRVDILLQSNRDGTARIHIQSREDLPTSTLQVFVDYTVELLKQRAILDSVAVTPIVACPECGVEVSEEQARRRLSGGYTWIACNVCEPPVKVGLCNWVAGGDGRLIVKMERSAERAREQAFRQSIVEGKERTREFDVFLCHNSRDKPDVKTLGVQLKNLGLLPWLDEWELRPGVCWQKSLEEEIPAIKCAAVCVGSSGIGPWQDRELDAFIREFVRRGCPVIPVVLKSCETTPRLPVFLAAHTWVDLRKKEPDPLSSLAWGITGDRSWVDAGNR
jgi:WD40 repeat protein